MTEERSRAKPQTFANVWDAIEDTPEEARAMTMRSDAMIAITARVRAWKVTRREAARRLGVTEPRLDDLLKGRIEKFTLGGLAMMAERAGFKPELVLRDCSGGVRASLTSTTVVFDPRAIVTRLRQSQLPSQAARRLPDRSTPAWRVLPPLVIRTPRAPDFKV
jgi:predicted XRE-type DNA-binding protein